MQGTEKIKDQSFVLVSAASSFFLVAGIPSVRGIGEWSFCYDDAHDAHFSSKTVPLSLT